MTKSCARTAPTTTVVDTLVLAGCSTSSSRIVASVMGPDGKVDIASSTVIEKAGVHASSLLLGIGERSLSGRLSGGADRG